jgi:hypothetical protein
MAIIKFERLRPPEPTDHFVVRLVPAYRERAPNVIGGDRIPRAAFEPSYIV